MSHVRYLMAKIRPFHPNIPMTEIISAIFRPLSVLLLVLINVSVATAQLEMEERPINTKTEIRYYGSACMTIQRSQTVLLTDPYIGNPSGMQVMLGRIRTDTEYVDKYINPAAFRMVKMVIASHGHFNHLMDLPYLSKYLPDTTLIVCNRTSKHILGFYGLPQQAMMANDLMGDSQQEGFWFYNEDRSIRTMAFKSGHPDKVAGIVSSNRRYTSNVVSEPEMMSDWQEGQTLSFLVDFLEADTIGYRMFFMAAMSEGQLGLFPKYLLKERAIDDLFIACTDEVEYAKYPGPVVELTRPKRIFLIHWEKFMRSKESDFRPISEKGLAQMEAELRKNTAKGTEIIIPRPLNYY